MAAMGTPAVLGLWLYAAAAGLVESLVLANASTPGCRDRFQRPFSSTSIWNTPIGSDARYAALPGLFAGNATANRGPPVLIQSDVDWIVRVVETDPTVDWYVRGFDDKNHCAPVMPTERPVSRARLPNALLIGVDHPGNNALAVLQPNSRSVLQMQPTYRCVPGGPVFARWGTKDGCPEDFPNFTDILGAGPYGAHGGSGLSAIGGTIRVGELDPANPAGIQHAIKMEFFGNAWYFGGHRLQPVTVANGGRTQYNWPATGSDDISMNCTCPGCCGYLGTDRHIVPGALLALPHAVARAAPISHPVALRVRDALQHYGAYLVDSSSGYANKVSMSVSQGVNDELLQLFNVSLAGPRGITPDSPGHSAWLYRDLLTLLRSLHAVTNNWPTSVGGGGTPLVPRAPPICGE